ncbi:DUF3016 domain-containing protein [Pseudoalteromonas sp. ACER1]|uniref:DUF3016 domain-containing protein n=2 Tax=Pseudoalteromonas TaxID=53246 RepID=A0ABU8SV30_9GAMM|nr:MULTISPECIES: DUF3016 domain-containing protein [unclassified Pseudoalteromonas]MCF2849605.1 DUF3016 domain-containing protein [Pseudoalteromonas sp. PAST1]MCO7213103.1 DUF3016 domain-containing protein [Pseudoalteromonas sp. ACER1]|tara:strand:- start:102 stop:605 length:504 start_codon:yes stop_codon:yes gene_type:complete
MKIVKKMALAMVIALPAFAHAGEAKVKWHDFNDYRDVRPGNNSPKGAFHKNVAKSFEKHFNKLAEQLPDGYTFNVEVTELDLAGDVRFGTMNELRIIKPIYFPRIDLNYSITDKDGKVISEAKDVKLKDMGFMDRMKTGRDEAYYYDKRLITDWFEDELLPSLNLGE